MSTQITTEGDRTLVVTRSFDAPRQLIWDCHTKPDLVRRWLLGPMGWSMPVCEIDLKVGGKFRYEWRHADGRTMGMGGLYREIEAPSRIAHVELFDDDWTGGETLNTLELNESGGKTHLLMRVHYANAEALAGALKTGMTDGMEAGYARIDALLQELKK